MEGLGELRRVFNSNATFTDKPIKLTLFKVENGREAAREIIHITGVTYTSSTSVEAFTILRGQEGTSPQQWGIGTKGEARLTAEHLNDFVDSATFNALEVGGTNLLVDSEYKNLSKYGLPDLFNVNINDYFGRNKVSVYLSGNTETGIFGVTQQVSNRTTRIQKGKTYTLSFNVQGTPGIISTGLNYIYLMRTESGGNLKLPTLNIDASLSNRVSITFTASWSSNTAYLLIGVSGVYTSSDWFTFHSVKLEEGNKATSWSPNPIDTENQISTLISNLYDTKADKDEVTTIQEELGQKAELGHTHSYSSLSNIPTTFPPESHTHSFEELSDKPETFPPTSHIHSISEVNGLNEDLTTLKDKVDKSLSVKDGYVTWSNQGDVFEFNTKNHISVFRGRHNGDMNWYVGTGASNSYDVYLSSYKHSTALMLRNGYAEFNRPIRVTSDAVNTWSSIQLGTTHGYWNIEASPNSHLPNDQRLNFKFVNTQDNSKTYLRFPSTNNQEQNVAYQSWVDSRISSNINNHIVPADTNNRDRGIYGSYDSAKISHIWSMGTPYRIPADGSNFGYLYGIAYKHTNNPTGGTMANGHQIVFVNNGVPGVSIGLDGNVWTKGQFMGSGAGLTNVPWGGVSGKPTTFPPATHTHNVAQITGLPSISNAISSNSLVQRDANGDIHSRLLRTNYQDQSTISGAIAFRINNSTDNFTRYCNSPAAVRTWLGLHNSATRVAAWAEVTGKPTTFPPSTHTHPWSQITGVPVQATRWPNAGEQGYTQSLSAAGWCKLPNGLILQWVKGSKTTKVNWPIAFKTIFLAVDSHLSNGSGNFDTDLFYDNVGVWGRYQDEFRVIGIGI